MEFTRQYTQLDRIDRHVRINIPLYQRIALVAAAEQCTLKEALTRLLEAGLEVYQRSKEESHS